MQMKVKSKALRTRQDKGSTMLNPTQRVAIQLELPLFATAESLPQSSAMTSIDKSPTCKDFFRGAEIIRDIGSGINFKRKGLQSLLDRLLRGDKFTLIVACRV